MTYNARYIRSCSRFEKQTTYGGKKTEKVNSIGMNRKVISLSFDIENNEHNRLVGSLKKCVSLFILRDSNFSFFRSLCSKRFRWGWGAKKDQGTGFPVFCPRENGARAKIRKRG